MDRRVRWLHCIMPIANLPSVLKLGNLSYDRVAKLQHESVAMQPVQDRRDQVLVPQGLRLHQYANLYFDPRNPMMYKRRADADALCVLAVARGVLTVPNVVITDRNAASPFARFLHPDRWEEVVFDDVFARSWQHPDDLGREHEHRLRKCAEVLVPQRVEPALIKGAYVVNAAADALVREHAPDLQTKCVPDMFFGK